ncbi:hypothetical protein [Nonomuraea recticatena]|uniref:Uncharacterized protein n=1 Tax=Nonomuraea recticatena TaxID=46178 RepID=A0ABN3T8S4_9ACTN
MLLLALAVPVALHCRIDTEAMEEERGGRARAGAATTRAADQSAAERAAKAEKMRL